MFELQLARGREAARALADMTGAIWNEQIDEEDYARFFENISLFPEGHLLVTCGQKVVATSQGFPMARVPTFHELNQGIYTLFCYRGEYYYLHLIQVLPEYRRQGIGDMLLKAQIDAARRAGCKQIVGIAHENSVAHWLKNGFDELEAGWGTYGGYGRFLWVGMNLMQS